MMLSFAFAPNNQLVRGVQLAESLAPQAEPVVVADKPILQPNQPDAFTPITPPPPAFGQNRVGGLFRDFLESVGIIKPTIIEEVASSPLIAARKALINALYQSRQEHNLPTAVISSGNRLPNLRDFISELDTNQTTDKGEKEIKALFGEKEIKALFKAVQELIENDILPLGERATQGEILKEDLLKLLANLRDEVDAVIYGTTEE